MDLPISFVIIGIGNENFVGMKEFENIVGD